MFMLYSRDLCNLKLTKFQYQLHVVFFFPGLKQWVMFCSFCPFGCLTVLSPVLYRTYSLVSDHLKIVHIWNIQHVIDIEI
jgi:hypothetical protein